MATEADYQKCMKTAGHVAAPTPGGAKSCVAGDGNIIYKTRDGVVTSHEIRQYYSQGNSPREASSLILDAMDMVIYENHNPLPPGWTPPKPAIPKGGRVI